MGRRFRALCHSGQTAFSADSPLDAVHRQSEVIDPLDSEASAGYDSVGNLTWQQDPEGHVTYFDFDAANRRIAVKDALAGITDFYHDENGNQTTLIDAEGHPTPEKNQECRMRNAERGRRRGKMTR